jgi:ELWxxDGT repeat protein
MAAGTLAAARHHLAGSAGGDLLRAADLTAFEWVRADGIYNWFAWGYDEKPQEGIGSASGRVIFAGVDAGSAFSATAASLRFSFTLWGGVAAGPELAPFAWSWDPATGVLDPGGGSVSLSDDRMSYAYFTRFQSAIAGFSWMYSDYGSQEDGEWRLAGAPAIEAEGGDGADTLAGATGADLLDGGEAGDRITGGQAGDTLRGGAGNDTLDGQQGDDRIEAGEGRDIASGGSGADTLLGGAGRDTLFGHAGDDLLEGGEGADLLIGGARRDKGWGTDTANYAGSAAGVAVDLAAGTGLGGDAEGDKLLHIAALRGSAFADTLLGDRESNRLEGGAGDDLLRGEAGGDTLLGGAGDDRLVGGRGTDIAVYGGRRADYEITLAQDGSIATVQDREGRDGADTLSGIEQLRFADATVDGAPPAEEALFFLFVAEAPGMGDVLWASDGTGPGTRIVKDFSPGERWWTISDLHALPGGRWLLGAQDPEHGAEPWVTDGTPEGTRLLADIHPGRDGSHADGFVDLGNGRLVFDAYQVSTGSEPWVTDGTPGGTHQLKEIAPGTLSSGVSHVAVLRPGLGIFVAKDQSVGQSLFVTDGTEEGTRKVMETATLSTGGWVYGLTRSATASRSSAGAGRLTGTSPG